MPGLVQSTYPALFLFPLHGTFPFPKQIPLPPKQRVTFGRQNGSKTASTEQNGYFDARVLSRQHAQVWAESGKLFIMDIGSANGTYLNGKRLSLDGVHSNPFQLKSGDILEFGVDILGKNHNVLHRKVAARVACIRNEHDEAAARREEPRQKPNNTRPCSSCLTTRKSGTTLELMLSRLQEELHKSRETAAELRRLSNEMTEIQNTLAGISSRPSIPSFLHGRLTALARSHSTR